MLSVGDFESSFSRLTTVYGILIFRKSVPVKLKSALNISLSFLMEYASKLLFFRIYFDIPIAESGLITKALSLLIILEFCNLLKLEVNV